MSVWDHERRALTTGLVATITLVAFEQLAVATILPDIKQDLGALNLYGGVFSAFFLGSLVGVAVAGRITDHRGPATAFALLRFRSYDEMADSLEAAGFRVDEVRDAPDRPGKEYVFLATRR